MAGLAGLVGGEGRGEVGLLVGPGGELGDREGARGRGGAGEGLARAVQEVGQDARAVQAGGELVDGEVAGDGAGLFGQQLDRPRAAALLVSREPQRGG